MLLSSEQAEALFTAGLDAAAIKAMASITPENRQRRTQLAQELSQFLQMLPHQPSLTHCSPEELLVYLEQQYIPRHAGTILANGQLMVAPSTISNVVSHLRMIFKEVGRGQLWHDSGRHGNPACAFQLQQWQQGHAKVSLRAGWRSTGAVELTEPKMLLLLSHLSQQAIQTPSKSVFDRALLIRDGFAFCLLWQTGLRGINAREITLDDFILPGQGRGPIRQYLDSHLVSGQLAGMQHPGPIQVHPLRTKTNAQNPHSISIQPSGYIVLDVWFWLNAIYIYAYMVDQPLQTYMVRASKPTSALSSARTMPSSSVYYFAEQPLSRGGLHGRSKHHLMTINAYEGESSHSFRRGMAQHNAAAGEPACCCCASVH